MQRYRYALVNGQRQEAESGLSGECPGCGQPMIGKRGEVRDRHWAHKGGHVCDPWWENKTEWHRAWQDQFPDHWQEVVCHADGKWHIADVKTERGWVIEFQHSYLEPEQRRSRDAFYRKVIWVIDATKERHTTLLLKAWEEGVAVGGNSLRKVFLDDCALLRKWAGGSVPVFFDIGEMHDLRWLIVSSVHGWAYVGAFPRAQFIESHRGGADQVFDDIPKRTRDYESLRSSLKQAPVPPPAFERHRGRRARSRRRF